MAEKMIKLFTEIGQKYNLPPPPLFVLMQLPPFHALT